MDLFNLKDLLFSNNNDITGIFKKERLLTFRNTLKYV